jgi:hypothetical protein
MGDKINPSHYKSGDGIQVIDVIEIFNLNFSRGNVIKYALRAGKKDEQGYEDIEKEIEDLKKCVWYAQREIERLLKLKDKL